MSVLSFFLVAQHPKTSLQSVLFVAQRAGLDGFLFSLLVSIFLAYLWPLPGTDASPVPLANIANYGVS
ncbi:MAG: hypothetical protein KKG00_13400, partial [Bacteroidetes bacterium]|nr:hypothetical protein [Bacteroidota bacterium]